MSSEWCGPIDESFSRVMLLHALAWPARFALALASASTFDEIEAVWAGAGMAHVGPEIRKIYSDRRAQILWFSEHGTGAR